MGADSFIRRASGLLVPMATLQRWKFLPHKGCEDCCAGAQPTCSSPATVIADCYTGTINTDCLATVSGMANDACTSGVCTGYNGNYTVVGTGALFWQQTGLSYPCPPGNSTSTAVRLTMNVMCIFGECFLQGVIETTAFYSSGHPDNTDVKRIVQSYAYRHIPTAKYTTGITYTLAWFLMETKCVNATSGGSNIPCDGITFPDQCDGSGGEMTFNFDQV